MSVGALGSLGWVPGFRLPEPTKPYWCLFADRGANLFPNLQSPGLTPLFVRHPSSQERGEKTAPCSLLLVVVDQSVRKSGFLLEARTSHLIDAAPVSWPKWFIAFDKRPTMAPKATEDGAARGQCSLHSRTDKLLHLPISKDDRIELLRTITLTDYA